MLYKQENQFVLQLVQFIQNYMLDKASINPEEKALFIPYLESDTTTKILDKTPEEDEKAQTSSISAATGTDSTFDEPTKSEKKKKKKKKRKADQSQQIDTSYPLLDEILSTYLPPEEKLLIKNKLTRESDVCNLLFSMYLSNKEAVAKNLSLELQLKDAQLKLAENEEDFAMLQRRHEELQNKHGEVTSVLEKSEYALAKALKDQQDKMRNTVEDETIKRRHELIKRCMEMKI